MFGEGIYAVRARRWGLSVTLKGHDQFWMSFDVLGKVDEHAPDLAAEPCERGAGNWRITLSSPVNTIWLMTNVQYLGYPNDEFLELDPDVPGAFDFEGVQFFARCRHVEYEGSLREQWTLWWRPSRSSKDRLRDLNAGRGFGRHVKEHQAKQTGNLAPKDPD